MSDREFILEALRIIFGVEKEYTGQDEYEEEYEEECPGEWEEE